MLGKFKDSVKEFSENVKSTVAEKELDEDTLDPLLEELRLKLLQNNVSLEAAEAIEEELRDQLLGEQVKRGSAEEKVNEAVKDTLVELLDDSFDLESELEGADKPPVVFMVGFNGSGKCVSSDSLIYTSSGILKASKLFDQYSDLEVQETDKGIYVEPDDLKVPAVSTESLKTELKDVSKVWKLESEELVDVDLSTGKEISVTPEHPFFRLKEGRLVKQTASTLTEGDYVMAPNLIENEVKEKDFWSDLSGDYYVQSSKIPDKIYDCAEGTLKSISDSWTELGYHEDAVQYWRRKEKAPLDVLRSLDIGIPEDAKFSISGAGSVELPRKPSKQLAELLGNFVAEGNIDGKSIHIHNKDEDFVDRTVELYANVFGIDPCVDEREDLYRISVGKSTIEKYMLDSLNLTDSKHSLSQTVMNWSKDQQASFLKGLFSGDGHVSRNQREIELATSSQEMANNVQYMLLNQGIISAKGSKQVEGKEYYRIRINGDAKLSKWRANIGFSVKYKSKSLEKALNKDSQYERTELVPEQAGVLKQVRESKSLTQKEVGERLGVQNTMVHHYENDSKVPKEKITEYAKMSEGQTKEFLEKLSVSDISWIKVEDVNKRCTEENVYDLTVPEAHNFVAEGIVIHNTTTTAKLGNYLQQIGEEVVLGAGDTFRAASIEQLEEHGEELGVEVISHEYESDPAAVAYDAVEHAEKEDKTALIDTAGRSHADENLMGELEKMIRVNEPDVTFLVVDALSGNDVLEQAEAYEGMYDAVIVTKMDIDENGGAIISISERSGKPVAYIGTGQEYEDIEEFDKEEFVDQILN